MLGAGGRETAGSCRSRATNGAIFVAIEKLLKLFHERRQKGFLPARHAHDLALAENDALVTPPGKADIGLPRFAGSVDRTSHYRHLDI